MTIARWRFINRANPSESIGVADFESARTLAALLQKSGASAQWFLQEEISVDSFGPRANAQAPSAHAQRSEIPQRPAKNADARPEAPGMVTEQFASEREVTSDLPVPHSGDGESKFDTEVKGEDSPPPPLFNSAKKSGKRRYHRYKIEFRVILVSGGKSFRTFSNDVSVGGMLLKQKIPAGMLNRVCTIFIGSRTGPENIELKCRIVGDPVNPCRIAFVDCDVVMLRRLENWVLHSSGPGPVPHVA